MKPRASIPHWTFAYRSLFSFVALLLLVAGLGACSVGGETEEEEDDDDDVEEPCSADPSGCVDARLTVQGATLVGGAPPPPSLDPAAPRLSSPEERVQTTQAPKSEPIDVSVDAVDGVAALLVRVNQANEHFRVPVDASTPAIAPSSVAVSKALFAQQVVLEIPALFGSASFCVDIAGEDLVGRVSNYRRICFILPQNDAGIAAQPRANAGGPQAVSRGGAAILDGSGSEAGTGATLATYAWTQTSGPAVALQNANTATASFTVPNDTGAIDLGFRLSVTDNAGRVSTNDTVVRINEFTVANLAGSWFVPEDDGVTPRFVITFFADGTYVKGGREDDPECGSDPGARPNGNGIEWGRFEYDTNAGEFRTQDAFVDTDGRCGLFEQDQGTQDPQRITVRGNQLDFTETVTDDPDGDFDQFTLTRVPDSAGVAGSWQLDLPSQEPLVVTFFVNGRFVSANTLDDDFCGGTEAGTWSVDASDVLTTTLTTDGDPCGGFDAVAAGSTLRVNAGRLELADGSGAVTDRFDRLPRPEVISRSALLGAWYIVDASDPAPATPADADAIVLYRTDGTYIIGTSEVSPECIEDYLDADPSLASGLDPNAQGAESASWTLDPGTGRVLTFGPVTADSNGSCGLYDDFSLYPANSLFATVVDDDTINVNGNGDFEGQFLRIPSTAPGTPGRDALVGAWQAQSTGELIVFFADGRYYFVDSVNNGGIERGNWSLDATDQLTTVLDSALNPDCIDTADGDTCSPASSVVDALTFNATRTQFTIPFDGTPGDPPQGFVFDKVP